MQADTRDGGAMRRWLAGGAALVVIVLAFAAVAFALHGGIGQAAAGVTASTPPDTVQVTVTERRGYTFPQGRQKVIVTDHAPVVVHQQTITDAATVRQFHDWLNEPADAHQALPICTANAPNAATQDGAAYTYTVTFTARGETVERVDVLMRCFGMAIQRSYAPSLTLSNEVGAGPNVYRIILLTYFPKDLAPGPDTLKHP